MLQQGPNVATTPFQVEFLYGHQRRVANGKIRPDAILIATRDIPSKGRRRALTFLEAHTGSESITGSAVNTVTSKLRAYAQYFDSLDYRKEWGDFQGFRVAFVTTTDKRAKNIQIVLAADNADFAIVASLQDLRGGFHTPVWHTHDSRLVTVFGQTHA